MIRRLLRFVLLLLTLVVVFVTASALVLRATNPKPQASIGWARANDMPDPRGESASAVADGRLVVVGGLSGLGNTSDAVSLYDFDTLGWRRGAALPVRLHHAAATGWRTQVFVSGGARSATDWDASDRLYSSRPGGTWQTHAKMPEGRQGHAMVTLGSSLYVVGGEGGTDRVLVYDIRRDRWKTGAAMDEGRDHIRAVAWSGRVWAIGGRSGEPTTRVDIYNPHRDRWGEGPALPKPMSAMAVGVVGGELHVVGGEDPDVIGGAVSRDHFVLKRGSRRWRSASPSILPVHGAAYGVHDGKLIVAGGASRQGLLSTVAWSRLVQVYDR